jgi:hypothetical protein
VVVEEAITITCDVHKLFCWTASTAMHENDVVPTGKSDPDGGEHVVETGVTPPVTVGVRVTATDLPSRDVTTGDGHLMVGPADVGNRPETSDEGGPVTFSLSYACTTK